MLDRLYGAGLRLHRGLYEVGLRRARRLPVPTLAVGALRAGGSGKTPVCLWLARRAASAGRDVMVLSRGYGGRGPSHVLDSRSLASPSPADLSHLAERLGDEAAEVAALLSSRPPGPGRVRWVTGKRRDRAYDRAADEGGRPDLVILDDGWTHHALRRDALVVLMHPDDVGARRLPMGPARLSASSIPGGALLWRHTEPDAAPGGLPRRPDVRSVASPTAVRRGGERVPLAEVGPSLLIVGTGSPGRVVRAARRGGLEVSEVVRRRDHAAYTRAEACAWAERARGGGLSAVATGKDHVKLGALWPAGARPLGWLEVDVRLEAGEGAVDATLDRLR